MSRQTHRDRVIVATGLLAKVADAIEDDDRLETRADVVQYLRDLALVFDLREFFPEIDIGWPERP